jgi:trehalose-phosphatase
LTKRRVKSGIDRFIAVADDRLDGTPLAVMLDVDGTLAPIAPTPEQAVVPNDTRDTLRRLLALRGVVVALVSGRSATDAWRIAGVEGVWVIGNHGFELRTPDGQLSPVEVVRPFEDKIAEAAHQLSAVEPVVPGAIVENKRWTMSVHYRLVDPSEVDALLERARAVARTLGLRVTEGKKIIELRPPVDVHKGTATLSLAQHLGAMAPDASILYAGDDRTDEDAIALLREHSPRAVTIHVSGANESLGGTRAEVVLNSTDEVREALELIVARRSRGASGDTTAGR